jgi:hypothetical protein
LLARYVEDGERLGLPHAALSELHSRVFGV